MEERGLHTPTLRFHVFIEMFEMFYASSQFQEQDVCFETFPHTLRPCGLLFSTNRWSRALKLKIPRKLLRLGVMDVG